MSEKCGCELCNGTRGGVPGNENRIDGKLVCDNCHADMMRDTASKHKDMFGRQIKVGDYIVYGAVDGRSGTLRAGQVIELKEAKDWRGVQTSKLFVKSWSNFHGRQKNVTLSFLDRLIVVPAETLSENIKRALEN